MTDAALTQKDLDLVDGDAADADGGAAGDTGAKDTGAKDAASSDKQADKAADKGADKPAKGGSIFDDDEDDGKDAGAKDKSADKGADEKAAKDGEGEPKADKDAAADAQWRDRVADRLLAKAKDTLPAAKFEKRREQVIKQLGRFKSMDDAVLSGFQAIEKIRSGDHKRLPTDATDEQAAAWRKENGIPEAPEAYQIPEISGHKWTDADEPVLADFKQVAHKVNLNQEQVNALAAWKVQADAQATGDYESKLKRLESDDREACDDALRAEFGIGELKPAKAVMKRLLEDDTVFGADGKKMISAYFYDEDTGMYRRLTSVPSVARGLIQLAMERYGDGAMETSDTRAGANNEIEKLETLMKTDFDQYVRSGGADKLMKLRQDEEARQAKRRR